MVHIRVCEWNNLELYSSVSSAVQHAGTDGKCYVLHICGCVSEVCGLGFDALIFQLAFKLAVFLLNILYVDCMNKYTVKLNAVESSGGTASRNVTQQ